MTDQGRLEALPTCRAPGWRDGAGGGKGGCHLGGQRLDQGAQAGGRSSVRLRHAQQQLVIPRHCLLCNQTSHLSAHMGAGLTAALMPAEVTLAVHAASTSMLSVSSNAATARREQAAQHLQDVMLLQHRATATCKHTCGISNCSRKRGSTMYSVAPP